MNPGCVRKNDAIQDAAKKEATGQATVYNIGCADSTVELFTRSDTRY